MAIFTVHTPPHSVKMDVHDAIEARFIPEHTTLLGLIFPPFWLAWQRLWWPLLIYVLVMIVIGLALPTSYWPYAAALNALPGFFIFLEGNQLRRAVLQRAGWQDAGVVQADNREAAELHYFHQLKFKEETPLVFDQNSASSNARSASDPLADGLPALGLLGRDH